MLALVDSGIDEDIHFWDNRWHDLEDDDLEVALNDQVEIDKMLAYAKDAIIEQLREALAKRREETARHSTD